MHTKDKLAAALHEAELHDLALLAANGHFDDFLSELAFPQIILAEALHKVGTPAAYALRERLMNGEFDATLKEAEAWAESPDGQTTFARLKDKRRG
jgi:hypothetical protein